RVLETAQPPVARGREGQHLERRLHDDPERPEGSDEELVEVVAGDVLHDATARTDDAAVGQGGPRSDEEVPHAAVPGPPEPVRVRGDHPADRRAFAVWWIEGEKLPCDGERRRNVGERRPPADGDREVSGYVIHDPRDRRGAELDVRFARVAQVALRRTAGDAHGPSFTRRAHEELGTVFGVRRDG